MTIDRRFKLGLPGSMRFLSTQHSLDEVMKMFQYFPNESRLLHVNLLTFSGVSLKFVSCLLN